MIEISRRRRLRRRADGALQDVEIPSPWSLDAFLGAVSRRRQRPILLAEAPALADLAASAQWWKLSDADVILYAPTQSTFYKELNVFHEVGHMLCEHDLRDNNAPFTGADMEQLTEAPAAAAMIFARNSRFDALEEQEAETTAYRLKLLVDQVRRDDLRESAPAMMVSSMRRALGRGV